MEHNIKCCGIVVAAGNSTRMGTPKQFLSLCGVPAIIRTLSAFEQAELIRSVVVVCREQDRGRMEEEIGKYGIGKVSALVPGGRTRQESVHAGVCAAGEADFFAIHDGARATVTAEEVDAVVRDAFRFGASTLAVPVKDTIKRADGRGFVSTTLERSFLWAVQTPQVFERKIYFSAWNQAEKDGRNYTDDCQILEHAGFAVHLCRGSDTNLKLTTADDVVFAEAAVRRREGRP